MADKPPATIGYAEYKSGHSIEQFVDYKCHTIAHVTTIYRWSNPYLRSTKVAKEKRERKFRIRLPKLLRRRGTKQAK